jgi:hypothetical protein
MDVNTKSKVRFAVGDVGGSFWEEVSYGGTDYIGSNYGWPDLEGHVYGRRTYSTSEYHIYLFYLPLLLG